MSHRLYGVGVEQHALFPADGTELADGLDGADLVVGKHDGHEGGILPDGFLQLFRIHQTVFMDVQQSDLIALFFQFVQGMQYGMVLELRGDDVLLPLLGTQSGAGQDGLVVGFAAAGGEEDLRGIGVDHRGDSGSCLIQCLLGLLTQHIQTGGVPVSLLHVRDHGIDGSAAHLRRSCIICVNSHNCLSPSLILASLYAHSPTVSIGF